MNILFLLAIGALGSATTLYGMQKDIEVNDDRIVIRVPGKMVVIDKSKDDENSIQIIVKGQDRLIRKIKIDKDKQIVKELFFSVDVGLSKKLSEERNKEITPTSSEEQTDRWTMPEHRATQDKSQMIVLVTVFKRYEGVIEEETFQQLLKEIKEAVDRNECHPVILEVLRELEIKTHFPFDSLRRRRWNNQVPRRDFWQLEDMTQDGTQDSAENTNSFDVSHIPEQENHLHQKEQVARQIEWIQQILKNRHEQLDDTLRTTNSPIKPTRNTDFSTEPLLRQLVHQSNIREIQGQIFQHQLRIQQLQLQQQFLSQLRQQLKLQISMGQQQGTRLMQMQELNRERERLQEREEELLETQMHVHLAVQKLQQELTRQEGKLQECLEDERREDERSTMKVF